MPRRMIAAWSFRCRQCGKLHFVPYASLFKKGDVESKKKLKKLRVPCQFHEKEFLVYPQHEFKYWYGSYYSEYLAKVVCPKFEHF